MTTPRGSSRSAAYQHVRDLLAADRCVVMDGGIATELQRLRPLKGNAGLDRAFDLRMAGKEIMVAYLLEVTRSSPGGAV